MERIVVLQKYLERSFEPEGPIEYVIDHLTQLASDIPDKCDVRITSEYSYDDNVVYNVCLYGPETDEQMEARRVRVEETEARRTEYKRRQLKQLKKELGED